MNPPPRTPPGGARRAVPPPGPRSAPSSRPPTRPGSPSRVPPTPPTPPSPSATPAEADLSARLRRLANAHGKLRDEADALRGRNAELQRDKDAVDARLEATLGVATRLTALLADSGLFASLNPRVLATLFDNLPHAAGPVVNRLSGELSVLRSRTKLLAEADQMGAKLADAVQRHERAVDGWRKARERAAEAEARAVAAEGERTNLELAVAELEAGKTDLEARLAELDGRCRDLGADLAVEAGLRAETETALADTEARLAKKDEELDAARRAGMEDKLRAELLSANLQRTREALARAGEEAARAREEADAGARAAAEMRAAADEASLRIAELEARIGDLESRLAASLAECEHLRSASAESRAEKGELRMSADREAASLRRAMEEARELHRTQIAERAAREAKLRVELERAGEKLEAAAGEKARLEARIAELENVQHPTPVAGSFVAGGTEASELRAALDAAHASNATLQSRADAAAADLTSLRDVLASAQAEWTSVAADIARLGAELESARAEAKAARDRAEEGALRVKEAELELAGARGLISALQERALAFEREAADAKDRLAATEAAVRKLESQRDRLIQVAETQERHAALEAQRSGMRLQESELGRSAALLELSKARDRIKDLQLRLAEAQAGREAALGQVEVLTRSVDGAVEAVAEPAFARDREGDAASVGRAPSVETAASSLEQTYDLMLDEMAALKEEYAKQRRRVAELERERDAHLGQQRPAEAPSGPSEQ
ncbi:hypothetical protein DFJ74DRAFT_767952 [Hyaloraphidium curvatum]|nr:hypothetical protein DFJ74DRAFT_767952 [Hyaloraphidium curvatum]